jgi:hypothetical protein
MKHHNTITLQSNKINITIQSNNVTIQQQSPHYNTTYHPQWCVVCDRHHWAVNAIPTQDDPIWSTPTQRAYAHGSTDNNQKQHTTRERKRKTTKTENNKHNQRTNEKQQKRKTTTMTRCLRTACCKMRTLG